MIALHLAKLTLVETAQGFRIYFIPCQDQTEA